MARTSSAGAWAIPTLFFTSILIYGILLAAPGGPEARFLSNPRSRRTRLLRCAIAGASISRCPSSTVAGSAACNPDGEGLGIFLSDTGLPNILPQFLGGGDNGIVHLDFGYSTTSGEPVTSVISARLLPTAILAGTALVVWIVIAFITGVTAAVKRYSKTDTAITIFNYVGYSFPTFWLGLMLIIVFSGTLHWLPAGGMWNPAHDAGVRNTMNTGRLSSNADPGVHGHGEPPVPAGDHVGRRQHRRRSRGSSGRR